MSFHFFGVDVVVPCNATHCLHSNNELYLISSFQPISFVFLCFLTNEGRTGAGGLHPLPLQRGLPVSALRLPRAPDALPLHAARLRLQFLRQDPIRPGTPQPSSDLVLIRPINGHPVPVRLWT